MYIISIQKFSQRFLFSQKHLQNGELIKSSYHLLMKVNHALLTNFIHDKYGF